MIARKALGIHSHSSNNNDRLADYIDRVRPTVMKWLDDDAGSPLVAYARDRGALTVLRVYESNQQLGAEGGRYIGRIRAAMLQRPAFMVAESMNEEYQEADVAARRAEFDIELMQAMDAIGRKAGILCASTGQPELAFWKPYLPALRYAADHGHYVCLHEYGGGPPGMKWGVGQNQQSGFPPGYDPCETNTASLRGWWVLRYRRHVDEWRRLGLTKIPRIYIGEGGLDDIWPRPGHGGKGYRDYIGEHPANIGDYAAQWAWTCRRWAEDEYMVGGVDFGWSTRDPAWLSFDMSQDTSTLDRVIAEMQRLPSVTMPSVPPTPQPPADPTPTPGLPPIQSREPAVMVGVLRGDGWWTIARRIWPTVRAQYVHELQRANTWAMPLRPGYVLATPKVGGLRTVKRAPTAAVRPADGLPYAGHITQPDETWAAIAARYGVTVAELRAANAGEGNERDNTPEDGVALVVPGWSVEVA